MEELETLKGRLRARFYDENLNLIKEVSVRELLPTIVSLNNVKAVVFDGIVTQRLVDIAKDKGIAFLVGIRKGAITKEYENIKIFV